MRDSVIREALHKKILRKYHEDSNSIVLDEFGVAHGAIRADIAVLNGILHGYEIKSAADTLDRLPAQISAYAAVFDKLTLVLEEKHLKAATKIAPKWCEIYLVFTGRRNAIHFKLIRRGSANKHVRKERLAQLLWRTEAINFLKNYNVSSTILNKPRRILYEQIAAISEVPTLRGYVAFLSS